MIKKAPWLLGLMFFLAISLLFIACNGDNEAEQNGTEPIAPHEAAIGQIDNPTDVVRLGFIAPITGADAAEGIAARNAFMLAVDLANELTELPFTIEAVPFDSQSSPRIALMGVERLLADETVVAVAGFLHAEAAAAAIPQFIEHEVPLIIWGATADQLTKYEYRPWILRTIPSITQEVAYLSSFVVDGLEQDSWFLFADSGLYGESALAAFKHELAVRYIEPLGYFQVAEGEPDFSIILEQIQASGARAIFSGADAKLTALLKAELAEAGMHDILFSATSTIRNDKYLVGVGEFAEGTLIAMPGLVLAEEQAGRRFLTEYMARNLDEPFATFTGYAYEAALVIIAALLDLDEVTPLTLAEQMLAGEAWGLMGRTTFDENGQTTNAVFHLQVVQDDRWTIYEHSEYYSGDRTFGGRTIVDPN